MGEKNNTDRILVGLWDCPYCGAKGLNGLKKQCPNCGHPQDEGTRFYLGEEKTYLEGEQAEEYGQGADWTCAYCGALNRYNVETCSGCGASREESTGDYFDNENKQAEKEARRQAEINAASAPAEPPKKKSRLLLFAIVAAVLAGLIAFIFVPRSGTASVSAKEWTRVLYTEVYKDVERSDWSLPSDATLLSSASEIHHYDSVLDHYEDVQVRRSREVLDYYDTETYTTNNGDGTFTEHSRSVPVYTTEYYYETERQPVYRQVPVYKTKYYYIHKEWVSDDPVFSSGTEEEPYWPEFTETATRRVASQAAAYKLTLTGEKDKTYAASVSEALFTALHVGDDVELTLSTGTLTAINGTKIR